MQNNFARKRLAWSIKAGQQLCSAVLRLSVRNNSESYSILYIVYKLETHIIDNW